jgi:hypothetical protein
MRYALILLLLAPAACAPVETAGADLEFGAHWHDGKAELDGYRLRISRYGEPRGGEAVMVFVTEPFSLSQRVKLDDPTRAPADAVDVLKLNFVRDFQTGIYDYNTMVSVFSRSDDFSPLKVSMSSAEWCGHVYEELIVHERTVDERIMSYFEGESGTRALERRDGVLEDNLYILLRGMRGPYLPPGGRKAVPFLPGPLVSRLSHRPAAWTTADIERGAEPERVTVPAGSFDAFVYVVRTPGREGRFHIEQAWPHRILKWAWQSRRADAPGAALLGGDETGELTGTARLVYWQLQREGDERYRKDLGLPARAAP